MSENINKLSFSVLVIYPLLLISLCVYYLSNNSLTWLEGSLFLMGYYISNMAVGLGLHRLWSHDSYKTNQFVEFILSIFAAATLQGPALSWASNHFKHHTYTDTDQDPHSPLKYKSKLKGFFWSHMGWMLYGEGSYKSIDRLTMVKLGRNKVLRWQLKYYWPIALTMNSLVPALVGFALGGNLTSAFAGFVFIGLGRALQQQITFFVNSLCHFIGTQKYTGGTSRDIWWLAFLLLGENWHNFHHAFPSDYRNGARWYQADIHKWLIYLMSIFGLAWDLNRTAEVRVEAKITKTMQDYIKAKQENLQLMQAKVNDLIGNVQNRLSELENYSIEAKENFVKSLSEVQSNLLQLTKQIKNFENPSEKIIKMLSKKVGEAELTIQKLYKELESTINKISI